MSDLYADDTTIHFSSNSISDINIKLNEDMEKVQGWCTSNDMVIKTMKSKSMIMGSSRKIQYIESNFNILYDDVLLNYVKYEKLLGITIDNCLSWCQQINNIVSKISSRLGLMCRLRTYLPTEVGRTNVVVDSVIIFCRSRKTRIFTFFISLEKHLKFIIS
jgi:hypothetical protein